MGLVNGGQGGGEVIPPQGGGSGIDQLTGDVTAGPGTGSVASTLAKIEGNPVSAASPSSGDVLTWDGSDWVNSPASGGGTTLSLTYNGQTFDVPVSSLPAGWSGSGTAVMSAQLTTGSALVSGLQDPSGNPVPDGWSFPADIFVEDSTIFDIMARSAFTFNPGGIIIWGPSGGTPLLVLNANGQIFLPGLATSDPGVANQVWASDDALVLSGFTPGGGLPANFQTGSGAPRGVVTPAAVGAIYLDTDNPSTGFFVAWGATNLDWLQLGADNSSGGGGLGYDAAGTVTLYNSEASAGINLQATGDGAPLFNVQAPGGGGSFDIFASVGNPNGVVTAQAVGDLCVDISTPGLWQATAADNAHWVPVAAFTWDDGTDTSSLSISAAGVQIQASSDASTSAASLTVDGVAGGAEIQGQSATTQTSIGAQSTAVRIATTGPGTAISAQGDGTNPAPITLGNVAGTDPVTVPGKLSTTPTDSHTATTAFGAVAVGTPIQNALGYDVLVRVAIPVSAAVGGSINVGVGPSATPTVDPMTPALSAAGLVEITQYVPNGYYLSVTSTGTITLGTPVTQVSPV